MVVHLYVYNFQWELFCKFDMKGEMNGFLLIFMCSCMFTYIATQLVSIIIRLN